MAITDPLILPPDVLLVPVMDLPADVRARLDYDEGDFAVTRPRARTPSRIVDAGAAELLAEFRSPRTIVDAVIRFSRARSLDPERTLEEAYPLLERLWTSGFLVEEGQETAGGIQASLESAIAGFEIVEAVQVLEDTELYQARQDGRLVALKIERPAAAGRSAGAFEREAAVLEHLDGDPAPRLAGQGVVDGRSWLAVEWCPGVDVATAASELRRRGDRAGLLALGRALVGAYVRLHARGIVHGDVHTRNALVEASGAVRLIDFGLARWTRWNTAPEGIAPPARGGVAFFFEPEYAAALLGGGRMPEATPASDQYAVGVTLYLLMTGAHSRDFSLEKERMLRQIAEEPPLPFAERGVDSWPEVEAVLARALAKDPAERFPSMADLAAALAAITATEPPPAAERGRSGPSAGTALLDSVLARLQAGESLFREGFPEAPRLSVNFGAAGAACALYRIALAREDAALLSLADLWGARAVAGGDAAEGFYNEKMELTPESIGRVSPWLGPSGPACIQALIANALGDAATRRQAIRAFLGAVREPGENLDVNLGRSGVVLAASMLLDILKGAAAEDDLASRLRETGDELLRGIWRELDELPPIAQCDERPNLHPNLGIAHGWAGYLYTTLRWRRSAGSAHPESRPERLEERLAELAERAQSWGRGLRWRWVSERSGRGVGPASMPGWCNGSAGFVHLWTLAHRELGGPSYARLAEGAAWNTWESPERVASLCCGLAGRSYALINFWKHGGGPEWLERAKDLADRAAREVGSVTDTPHSLYKGHLGVAVLAADLARPEAAVQPFFEEEGW